MSPSSAPCECQERGRATCAAPAQSQPLPCSCDPQGGLGARTGQDRTALGSLSLQKQRELPLNQRLLGGGASVLFSVTVLHGPRSLSLGRGQGEWARPSCRVCVYMDVCAWACARDARPASVSALGPQGTHQRYLGRARGAQGGGCSLVPRAPVLAWQNDSMAVHGPDGAPDPLVPGPLPVPVTTVRQGRGHALRDMSAYCQQKVGAATRGWGRQGSVSPASLWPSCPVLSADRAMTSVLWPR